MEGLYNVTPTTCWDSKLVCVKSKTYRTPRMDPLSLDMGKRRMLVLWQKQPYILRLFRIRFLDMDLNDNVILFILM